MMNNVRKILLAASGALVFFMGPVTLSAEAEVIATPRTEVIGNNLDLEAIVSIFNQSTSLADFERRLNDSPVPISNIDYNHDGEIDYIRPVEAIERYREVVILQSVLGDGLYADLATIEVCASKELCHVSIDLVPPAKAPQKGETNTSVKVQSGTDTNTSKDDNKS